MEYRFVPTTICVQIWQLVNLKLYMDRIFLHEMVCRQPGILLAWHSVYVQDSPSVYTLLDKQK